MAESQNETMRESLARGILSEAAARNREPVSGQEGDHQQPEAKESEQETSPRKSLPRYDEDERLPETVPESVDAYQSQKRTPRLSSQHSAPGDMEAMLEPRPALGKMKAASFTEGSASTGDTQPYSSQLVKSWRQETEGESMVIMHESYQQELEEPKTLEKGDAGYIDLAAGFVPSSPFAETQKPDETQDYDDLLKSPVADESPEDNFKVPARPSMPETPALKRGDSLPSGDTTAQTNRLSDFFGGHQAGFVGQSQLFDMTQNPSSPMPDGPRSDPAATRPSPSEHTWSPRNGFSSPTDMRTMQSSRPRSAPGEPRSQYLSKEESQKRKALARKLLEERLAVEGSSLGDDYDELFDDSQIRRTLRRTKSDRISDDLDRMRAPRSGSRLSSDRRRKGIIDLVTPATTKREMRVEFSLDELDQETDEEEDDLPQDIVHEDDDNEPSVDDNENDQYDEFSQTIMRSHPGDGDEDKDEDNSTVSVVQNEGVEMEDVEEAVDDQAAATIKLVDHAPHAPNTQGFTIVDSQTATTHQTNTARPVAHVQQSSIASFVPGSQYQGKTSEEQTILASSQRRSQSRVAASQFDAPEAGFDSGKVPSSPPLVPAASTAPEDSEGAASLARRELLEQFQNRASSLRQESAGEREIPESDLPEPERPQTAQTANDETQETSGAPYSTARTHVSGSARSPAKSLLAPSPSKYFMSQQSRESQRTPGGIRFSKMPALVPADSSFEDAMDVAADMADGLMTTEDHTVFELSSDPVEQPRAKRRKLNSNTSSVNGLSDAHAATTPPTSHSRPDADMRDQCTTSGAPGTIAESEQDLPHQETPVRALRDSPNKANETPAGLSLDEEKLSNVTTESQLLREKAGAHAVSLLVAARPEAVTKRSKAATYGKASRRKSIKSTTPKKKLPSRARAPEPMSVDAVDDNDEAVEEAASADVTADQQPAEVPDVEASEDQEQAIKAPNRIFALFKGQFNQFFPATWLGGSADGMSCKVRFDDGTITNIETQHVRSLQLKVDDNIKVDIKGMRSKAYVIVGFGTSSNAGQTADLETDVYGHTHVKVQTKTNRNSLPAAGTAQSDGEVQEVPIVNVYLSHTMWIHFDDRKFVAPGKCAPERQSTPSTRSTRSGTPATATPGSRRRAIKPMAKVKAEGRVSHLREASVASSTSVSSSAIFTGMVFAISYVGDEAEKAEVTRQIQRNGGTILSDGFEELFDLPEISEHGPTSPRKKKGDAETPGLRLKAQHENLGFVALIADRHSRRAKYMQALALGLPTLSGRWILHSLDASSTITNGEVTPLAWDKYLLPAGESSYLGGAIRSRTFTPYPAHSASLQDTIASRPLVLNNLTILLGPPKKGKSGGAEKRQTYAFLTRALGAGHVKRIDDLSKAKLDDEPKLVYVDGDVEEAAGLIFGKSAAGKKRKRASEGVSGGETKMSVSQGNVKIVSDEFVVQSLILGALVD